MITEDGSILVDIRNSVVGEGNTDFDNDLIQYINSSLSSLNQIGVGEFVNIRGEEQQWSEFIPNLRESYVGFIPLYISLNTKLLFDPPPPSSVEYHSQRIKELLWRIKVASERGNRDE